ncbi:hypothetical protein RDWZM_008526 [Blomia tropicalis]|uniref:Uncharacterized protein n=1 Tax=Blomia tropicalis TaxID=40697 RepID=A0A9Q0M1U8_BLOTA|nr:hypothetical protein RDWZM_008526 [Blomia tropicalis]
MATSIRIDVESIRSLATEQIDTTRNEQASLFTLPSAFANIFGHYHFGLATHTTICTIGHNWVAARASVLGHLVEEDRPKPKKRPNEMKQTKMCAPVQ